MIKKLLSVCLFIFAAATCVSAQKTRVYIASDFNKINFSLPIDLYLSVGPTFEIKATGDQEDIQKIVVEKKGNTLYVKTQKNGFIKFSKGAKMYVSMPKVEALGVAGSGDIYTKGVIVGDLLNLSIAGSGSLNLESANTNNIEVSIAGSGEVTVAEKSLVEHATYKVAGSGEIDAKNIVAKEAMINIAGSGNVICYASKSVDAHVAGSGDVTCYGNPSNVEKRKAGSGNIYIK